MKPKPKAKAKAKGTKMPKPGKCGARLRGEHAGRFCDDDPLKGRTRCRIHGGASPRAEAHPRFKSGITSIGPLGLEIFRAPLELTERQLLERWRHDPEEALRFQVAEGSVIRERALRAGNVDAYARLGTMIASSTRALVSLHTVPPPDETLPKFIEAFEGKTLADFEHDLEVIRRDADHPAELGAPA